MICTPKTCNHNSELGMYLTRYSVFSVAIYIEFSKIQSVCIWLGAIGVSTICNLIRPKYHAKYPKLFGSQFTCHKLFSTNGSADDIKNDSPYSL